MRIAKSITLTAEERTALDNWAHGRSTLPRLALRAKIVLVAAEGRQNVEIARELGCTRRTVGTWRIRFGEEGLSGLDRDPPRSGRTAKQRMRFEAEILRKTMEDEPPKGTRWSTRSLARELGCGATLVHRVWRDHGLTPPQHKDFEFSKDLIFAERLVEVAGLYIGPFRRGLALLCSKSPVQPLERTQEDPLERLSRLKTMPDSYKRDCIAAVFNAIAQAEDKIISKTVRRHCDQAWSSFLKSLDAVTSPEMDLHLIVDGHAPDDPPNVKAWLERHQRVHHHSTSSHISWLRATSNWFYNLRLDRVSNGLFLSIVAMTNVIRDEIHNCTDRKTLVWVKETETLI